MSIILHTVANLKKFDLGKIWIFLSCVWYIYIKNKYKKNSEHTILVPHYLNLDLNHTHLQGSILVVSLSNIISPVSPHDSHVCAYIADSIYSPALMCITLAVNFFTLPNSLALSDAMRWSIALTSCATLSIEISFEPCQIE